MNARYKIAFAVIVGAGLGAAAIEGLHAQAKPPVYAVAAIRKINDAESFKPILAKGPTAAEAAGGHFVIRTDKITSLDGNPPARFILIEFDNVEKAQAWHNSEAQKEAYAIRLKTTDSLSFIVEGTTK